MSVMDTPDLPDTSLAQTALIGSMLIDERCIPSVLAHVGEADFAGTFRTIFRAIKGLFLNGSAVDPVTVLHALGDLADYRRILMECMEVTPSAANAGHHAQVLREQNRLLQIRELGSRLAAETDLSKARKLLEDAAALAADRQSSRIVDMAEAMKDFADRHSGEVHYLSWPIRELTHELGVEQGDFVVVGGRPSTGKTALTIQCAFHWAKTLKVGYFSLETNRRKVVDRLVSHAARINKGRIRRNQMTHEDWDAYARVSSMEIVPSRLWIIEAAGMTVAEIQAFTVMMGFDIIIVDYLQLISEPGRTSFDAVTSISKKLHVMAQSRGVTIIALSQLSRMDKQNPRYATMADLRESGQIEQDADIILMLNPEDPKKPVQGQNRLLRVEKNKEGDVCQVTLEFEGHFQTFKKAPTTLDERMGANGHTPQRQPDPVPPPDPEPEWDQMETEWIDPF